MAPDSAVTVMLFSRFISVSSLHKFLFFVSIIYIFVYHEENIEGHKIFRRSHEFKKEKLSLNALSARVQYVAEGNHGKST